MTFGTVPLRQALGAILAHSVRIAEPAGVFLVPKGTVLTEDHIAELSGRGLTEVTVARLEPSDLHEDDAAQMLAEALVQGRAGLRVGAAARGRVNLIADAPGIVDLDAEAIHAANRLDPGLAIATVPQWHRLAADGLAATIKIIPYGVPKQAVEAACARAKGAMGLRTAVFQSATLVETVVAGAGSGAGQTADKGHRVTSERLDRLGVTLGDRVLVDHRVPLIAEALQAAQGEVLLILTGSATSDTYDIAPCGLRAAGGEVSHFGMPVDPGNLLFLGSLGTKPVIGLPGCARSPALNGADWVLERVLCGVPVGASEIMAMGVGGLLKEIPSRPQPRRG